jgi:hypothetical protein
MDILAEKVSADAEPAGKEEVETNDTREEDREHDHSASLVRVSQRFYEYVMSV